MLYFYYNEQICLLWLCFKDSYIAPLDRFCIEKQDFFFPHKGSGNFKIFFRSTLPNYFSCGPSMWVDLLYHTLGHSSKNKEKPIIQSHCNYLNSFRSVAKALHQKGGESAFIFIQSYLITSKTHMLEIIFAGAGYFHEQEYGPPSLFVFTSVLQLVAAAALKTQQWLFTEAKMQSAFTRLGKTNSWEICTCRVSAHACNCLK